jgi:hypothetical protein
MTNVTGINYDGYKNRIINGAMVIDQRNAGASVTVGTSDVFVLDRWVSQATQASKFSTQQNAGSVTPPVGYKYYSGNTSLSAYSVTSTDIFVIQQPIEGYNIADLGWGTANASAVTLSFWVRSSLTGTFGGALSNSSLNRSYPFTYTVSSANTWEQKSITVAGDTTGTWLSTNGLGIRVFFGLGVGSTYSTTAGAWAAGNYWSATGATSVVGTNGATFYITGVQLEKGSTATSFDYRSYGQELALAQRYFEKSYNIDVAVATNTSTGMVVWLPDATQSYTSRSAFFKATKRATPTVTLYGSNGASGKMTNLDSGTNLNGSTTRIGMSLTNAYVSGVVVNASETVGFHWTSESEL